MAMRSGSAVLAMVLLGGGVARADGRDTEWQGRGGLSYVTSADFRGGGMNATLLRQWKNFAAGFTFDAAVIGASGIERGFGQRYSFTLLSMLLAGTVQVRVPIGPVTPYVELAAGFGDATTLAEENTQCSYGLGAAGGLAGGLTVDLGNRMAVGARGAARTIAGKFGCTDVGGPKSFDTILLYSAGATFELRW